MSKPQAEAIRRVARRYLRAEIDFNDPLTDLYKVGKFLASQVPTMDGASVAYGSYVSLGVFQDGKSMIAVEPLKDALLKEYGKRLLSWFEFALLKRANLGVGRKLREALSDMVADIPKALVQDRPPKLDIGADEEDSLDQKKLIPALRKIMSVVQEDADTAGILEAPIPALRQASMPQFPVRFDKPRNLWYVVPNPLTYDYRQTISRLGFKWNSLLKRWERRDMPPNIARMFDVEGNHFVAPPPPPPPPPPKPALEPAEALKQWFIHTWYPKNAGRLDTLFTTTIRGRESSYTVTFGAWGSDGPKVDVKRKLTTYVQAIEELRHRYIGRQGREAWLETMDRVVDLAKTSDPGQLVHLIDRLNNLQHSNGLFMEHFPPDVKKWYLPFLNAKYHAPTPILLARYIRDSDLRQFLEAAATWDEAHLRHTGWEDSRDFQRMEKDKDPDAVAQGKRMRELNYPYYPGQSKVRREDPRVQEGLDDLRHPHREPAAPEPRQWPTYEPSKSTYKSPYPEQWQDDEGHDPTWWGRQAALLAEMWGPTIYP